MVARRHQADRTTRTLTTALVIATLVAASISTFGWAPVAAADTVPTIASDQSDYLPGATVVLTGSGWQPSELVHIAVNDSSGETVRDVTVSADGDGAITDSFELPGFFVPSYDVTATGTADPPDVASTSFTDLPIGTYDQCSNDLGTGYTSGDTGCRWTNGVLNPSNSTYSEGDATVQRLWLINLLPGSTHTLTLTYDTTEGGIHAYDFLTTWNWSEDWITSADRCQDITGCTLASTESTVDIPEDPNVPNTFEPSAPGDRQFVMRGGSLVSATTPALVSGSYAGNSTTSLSVTFNVDPGTGAMCSTSSHGLATCGVALWFGAHVAAGTPAWGSGLGAANVSGAPYHVSLGALDGNSLGTRANGANGMQGAVIPSGSLTLGKSLSGGPVGYAGPFTIHYDCGGTSTGDVSLSAGDSTTIPEIPAGAVCTVTEPTLPSPPTGYSFGSPSFTDSSGTADDGIVTIEDGVAVAVTTNNTLTRDTGTLTIAKTLSNPDGAPVPSSFTINYNCGTGYTGSRSVTAGGTAMVSGIPTGNTCTVSEAALAPIAGYAWAAPSYSPASIVISDTTSTFTLTVANSITRNRGTLTIAKTLSNPDGAPVPSSFTINYNCGTGYTGSRSVTAGGTAMVSGIPTGNTCTVSEAALAPIAGYAWAAPTYSPASIVISDTTSTFTLTVANSITRNRGTLTIAKTLSNPDGAPVPSSFTINYNCGTGYTGSRSVTAGGTAMVSGIPTGNTCTVSEAALAPIAGYAWAAPSYSPASIVISDTTSTFTLTVANSITRNRGTLTIAKTLSNPDGAPVPSSFTINYNCGTGYTGSRSVTAGGTAMVSGIPTGNTCTVSEAALAPIAGYAWAAPSYSPASIVISDTTSTFTLTVANSITRNRGTLTIAKTLSNPDGAPVPSSFTINYNCGTGYTGSRSVTAGGTATVSGIPTGNTCTVSEAALAPIAGYAWAAPSYSPASIVISNTTSTFTLTVVNSIRRDNTPPACALTSTIPGPPTVIQVTTSDGGSGLKTIVVTNLVNATVSTPPFTIGSAAPVVVSATKINQSLKSELALQVTDVAGNVTNCDPLVLTVVGPVVAQTLTNVSAAEHVLTVINGSPGLGSAVAIVNGTTFTMTGLKAGERRTIDIGSAMTAGSANTVKLYGVGKSGSSATIVLWDGIGAIT